MIDRGLAGHAVRHRHRDLVALADITHVCRAVELDVRAGHALGRDLGAPARLELAPGGVDLGRIGARLLAHQGADVVTLHVGDVQAEGGQIAGVGRRQHALDAEEVRHLAGEQAARAAERDEGIERGVTALHHGDPADAVDLVGRGDLEHAGGRLLRAHGEMRAELLVSRARARLVEREARLVLG